MSNYSLNDNDVVLRSGSSNHRRENTSLHRVDSMAVEPPMDPDMQGFETPDFEFDDLALEISGNEALAADEEDLPELNNIRSGRITPDGLIEEDFEEELGCPAQEVTVQEAIDRDYADISQKNILQIAGDDKLGRKIIVFSACRLPEVEMINHQRLMEYVKKTLEQYVSSDYCLVYFHYGFNSRNKPSLSWMRQAYREFDRDFKKNLKALYLVHPTKFIRFIWTVFKPLLSGKFGKKVLYINRLDELCEYMHLDQLPIPQRVKSYDHQLGGATTSAETWGHTSSTPPVDNHSFVNRSAFYQPLNEQQFGVSLSHIKNNHGGEAIAPIMRDCINYIRVHGMDVEGIFRRVPPATLVKEVRQKCNAGIRIDLKEYSDPHLAAVLLKNWLRELTEPLMTFELYDDVIKVHTLPEKNKLSACRTIILEKLPDDNYEVLNYLMSFLTEVVAHSSSNRMTALNLAIVFGPNIVWSRQQASLTMIGHINSFTQQLITYYDDIFIKDF